MTISDVYGTKILEDIIRAHLEQGDVPSVEEIVEEYNTFVTVNDISAPLFDNTDYTVARAEISSALKYNGGNNAVKQDIDVLLKAMYQTTTKATQLFDKWETKSDKLENRILGLESRIGRLLTITQDTAGFFDVVGDKFTDTNLIELDCTNDVVIDLKQNIVSLAKATGIPAVVSRIALNDLKSNQAKFAVLTKDTSIQRTGNEKNTLPVYAFYDENRFWKTHVYSSKKVTPVIAELTLSLAEEITLSAIKVKLHSSESNSTTTITPLYSCDGINYSRIPAINTTIETLETAEFRFPELNARYFKFILEKSGHDLIDGSNNFLYEFGAKEILFLAESFADDNALTGKLVSQPLSVRDEDNNLVLFNKVTLEVCDTVPDDTFLDYFIAIAQDSDGTPSWLTSSGFSTTPIVGGEDTRLWSPISPLNREVFIHPEVLDFATLSNFKRSGISISYDRDGGDFVSPAAPFTLMTTDTAGSVAATDVTATNKAGADNRRYFMPRPANFSLDLQIEKDVNLDLRNVVLWRNVGEQNITPGDTTKLVRGRQIGWEYQEPYYSTVVSIENTLGLSIDVGNNPIIIDEQQYTGLIGPDILFVGTHKIRVHKDYWKSIPSDLTTLNDMQAADGLYPHNQKLLIEGYNYPTSWTEEKVYTGVDLFAGVLMDKVSVFDIINNVRDSDYGKFALDTDAPATSTLDASPSTDTPLSYVFVLNANNSIADFMNEQFMLEFNLTDELYSYTALKAELKTESTLVGPAIDEYRIKLGS